MIIINDLHVDVNRSAGTTQLSVIMLNTWLIQWLELTLRSRPGEDLLINGDLFDRFNVSNAYLLQVYSILLGHAMTGAKIYLVRGNHDYANDTSKMPSIELLYNLLIKMCDVTYISNEEVEIRPGVWALPHLKNQDEFSAALKGMIEVGPKVLFLHCNYDNGFALESDHSLNLSKEVALKFAEKGTTLILGHEHHKRSPTENNVVITGNQVPSSIYDCLGFRDKYYHTLDDDLSITEHLSWVNKESYVEIDCQKGYAFDPSTQFIRITGEVDPEEFPSINQDIVALRKTSEAFVIGTAINIKSTVAAGQIEKSIEELNQFQILPEILAEVTNKEHKSALEGIVMEMEAAE